MMPSKAENCILVIFGASGDLTYRKLVPGLFNLYKRNMLPENFAVLGVARSDFDDAAFREKMQEGIQLFANEEHRNDPAIPEFLEKLFYTVLDFKNYENYQVIKTRLNELNPKIGAEGRYLFYMSTPPSLFDDIAMGLGQCGLNHQDENWRRLIVEKPFGYDLESARALNKSLHKTFQEDQIYRIDHYLGKETVQNMLVFRFSNGIFEPLWNRNYIQRVEITSAESIGVGNRGGYYDHSGALRDMFQNHLLQVVGMVAMEPPVKFNADAVRNETIKVFKSMRPLDKANIGDSVVRGQYTASTINGKAVKGYREEKDVAQDSKTPTYVAVKFYVDNWRWSGVPFYVRSGKYLPTRVTEVVIHFNQTPHHLFGSWNDQNYGCNKLIIRIQPDEGILMKINVKLPGGGFTVKTVNMDFHYDDLADSYLPQAYERLLMDAILGDATLYARNDAVEACWEFVTPILEAWRDNPEIKIFGYPAGTWGPLEATALFGKAGDDWRYPCKNLAHDGEFCEL